MTISSVQLLSIPVTDQDAAKAFYVDVLGFDVIADVPLGPDRRWLQVRPVGAQTSIALVTWFDSMPAGSMTGVVLETPDVDEAKAVLEARGVAFSGDIEEQPWGRFAMFSDPDGNDFILQTTAASFA
jgi:catechol 2,3-dioxygenase-like lactoylglutathione lyase family enzyme